MFRSDQLRILIRFCMSVNPEQLEAKHAALGSTSFLFPVSTISTIR